MMLPLMHHGMLIVGVPYSVAELMTTTRGGTPYGPTAVVGPDATQRPTDVDLAIARALGRRVAEVAAKLRA
jgi:NAD(P)H dehydrogenase (quinone)